MIAIEKLDLAKSDPNYYKAGKDPEIRDLDAYYYLSIEGQSSPEDPKFHTAMEKLYSVAYGIKFLLKAEDCDFTVPKMEGFWFVKGGVENQAEFENTPRDEWCWKIIIRMPDFVEETHYFRAVETARVKKGMEGIDEVKFELINEGRVVQLLHIGSYKNEGENIKKLHRFIADEGLQIAGYHHEIYLSDARRTPEDKLKTIIRYAVK